MHNFRMGDDHAGKTRELGFEPSDNQSELLTSKSRKGAGNWVQSLCLHDETPIKTLGPGARSSGELPGCNAHGCVGRELVFWALAL